MAPAEISPAVSLEVRDYIGIITIDRQRKLNALSRVEYAQIGEYLEELAAHPDTYITLITAKGHFFSAGADFGTVKDSTEEVSSREFWVKNFVSSAFYNTNVWYSHPKILIAALNGPVVGITASFISHCDFIYAAPHTYVMTPFSSLGLSAEGGASRTFVTRMGPGLANEALIMGKRIPVEDLLAARFVNKVFSEGGGDSKTGKGFDRDRFLKAVLEEIDNRLGKHLVKESMLKIKGLMRKPEIGELDKATVGEVLSGLKGFLQGIPQEEFRKLASGEKRHKL